MRLRSIGVTAGQTFIVDQVMLFNEKVYYEIDWSKESCKKFPLNTEFISMQVPANAELMGQSVLGSSSSWGMGVLTNTWYGKLLENGHYTTAFTEAAFPFSLAATLQRLGGSPTTPLTG
ncbi:ependymin-2-like [Pelmatolapia mariae]|uniref:ependymin-2-like n=1 Tax=Pelmatolapia mariae TaxID=158779 RepID=UPI002FE6652C